MSDEIIEEYRIPIRHERGTYALGEVSVPENYDGEVMTVKHTEYPIYGLQFHPESILTPEGIGILTNFIKK